MSKIMYRYFQANSFIDFREEANKIYFCIFLKPQSPANINITKQLQKNVII